MVDGQLRAKGQKLGVYAGVELVAQLRLELRPDFFGARVADELVWADSGLRCGRWGAGGRGGGNRDRRGRSDEDCQPAASATSTTGAVGICSASASRFFTGMPSHLR
jgi:hypothetical protein